MTAIHEVAIAALSATTVGSAAAAVLMARSRRTLSRSLAQAQEGAAVEEQRREEALRQLVSGRLPSLALHLRSDHYPVPGLEDTSLSGTDFADLLDSVQALFAKVVLEERHRVDAAARAALRGAFMEVQAKSYQLQTDLDTLQQECEDEQTLKNYFRLDHLNEQLARLVQKGAIVAGSWPGLVRSDTHVPDLVTGATSRLHGFERINVHSKLSTETVGVVGRAAEPIAVACTELLANALESSRADLSVEVTLLQTDNGAVCIQIDDAGKGMTAEEASRAAQLLAGRRQVLLTELGDPPALGFAAVGRLAADHGFQVTVDQASPYSGVRAIITIPPALVTSIDPHTDPLSAMSPVPTPAPRAPRKAITSDDPGGVTPDSDALPQRRRRRPRAPGLEERTAAGGRPPEPEQARTTWDDYERGIAAAGRAGISPDTRNEDRA
ncbi:ATP-binding protein [Streptomyces albus]|uniref:ATP-binding protein n=1 Tax=Streptomyces sp. NRRL F-5917 TaxID=1463873 RepID=UPI000691E9B3|nr:ATP-binding protein [Streptomyces sp. NRRL F-5917]